jgi:hypothetical protein
MARRRFNGIKLVVGAEPENINDKYLWTKQLELQEMAGIPGYHYMPGVVSS